MVRVGLKSMMMLKVVSKLRQMLPNSRQKNNKMDYTGQEYEGLRFQCKSCSSALRLDWARI
jgi:hypothetical protein